MAQLARGTRAGRAVYVTISLRAGEAFRQDAGAPGGPEVGMHEESGRAPLRGGCRPIERSEHGGRRSAGRRAAAPPLPATGVHIELLDGFACYAEGTAVDLAPSAERLLAFVAVQGGRVGRGIVIAALWPDRDDQRGGGNLRSVIWRLPEPVRSAVCLHNGEVSLADASCDAVELVVRARASCSRAGKRSTTCRPHRLPPICSRVGTTTG